MKDELGSIYFPSTHNNFFVNLGRKFADVFFPNKLTIYKSCQISFYLLSAPGRSEPEKFSSPNSKWIYFLKIYQNDPSEKVTQKPASGTLSLGIYFFTHH